MQNAFNLSNQKVIEKAEKKFGRETNKIFLLTTPISGLKLSEFELLFNTPKKVFCKKDEQFYLYKRKHEQ